MKPIKNQQVAVFLLMVEDNPHIFTSISRLKEYLLNNEDDEMNDAKIAELLEQQTVETMYAEYVYDRIILDE